MESYQLLITKSTCKNGNLNLCGCGRDFFPDDVFGSSSREKGLGVPVIVRTNGSATELQTDIPTDANTGKMIVDDGPEKAGFFRPRLRRFIQTV